MAEKEVLRLKSLEEISEKAYRIFLEVYENCKKEEKRMLVAFSGGKTPRKLFKRLRKAKIDWKIVDICLVDERYLEPEDPSSNLFLLKTTLLDRINISSDNISIIDNTGDILEDADEYLRILKEKFGGENGEIKFDLIYLGMGADGHTGSIFPENLEKMKDKEIVVTEGITRVKYDRISIGLPIINNAGRIVVLIAGERKKEIFRKVYEEKDPEFPASFIGGGKGNVEFLVDF